MKTNDLIRPSSLPKLQECRCYVSKPGSSPAAERGTALDALIRELWDKGLQEASPDSGLNEEDSKAVKFALGNLKLIAGDYHVETLESELQAIVPVEGVKAGTMDALCVEGGWLADFKTGQIRDYHAQMAAYALACMDAYFADEWTSHLLFVDQRQVISHRWTREEAEELVLSIVNAPQEPTLCDYCKWCAGFEVCPLVHQAAAEVTALPLKKMTADDKSKKVLPPALSELLGDHAAAHAFLTKLGIVSDWAEALKRGIREQLNTAEGEEPKTSDYFSRIVMSGSKKVNALSLGRYWEEFGWQRILRICSQIPLSAVEKEWKEVFGDKPIPEDIITTSGASVQLRLKKLKPQTK